MGGEMPEESFWRGSASTSCMGRPHWGQRMPLGLGSDWLVGFWFTLGTENALGLRVRLVGWVLVLSEIGEWVFKGRCGAQRGFELLEFSALLGAEEAVGAELLEAVGQDML